MIREHMADIGKLGTVIVSNGLTVTVQILDVKEVWGRTRWLVTPVAGEHEAWVEYVKFDSSADGEIIPNIPDILLRPFSFLANICRNKDLTLDDVHSLTQTNYTLRH